MIYDFEKWMSEGRESKQQNYYHNKLFLTGEYKSTCADCGADAEPFKYTSEYWGSTKQHDGNRCANRCGWSDEK